MANTQHKSCKISGDISMQSGTIKYKHNTHKPAQKEDQIILIVCAKIVLKKLFFSIHKNLNY